MTDILDKLSCEILSREALAEIFGNPKDFPVELVEKLSIETARRYWFEEMEYQDGDVIMNNLFSFWRLKNHYFENFGFGDISWKCYLAFDAGEYYRRDDDNSIDPAEKYTKPLIEELLKQIKLIE